MIELLQKKKINRLAEKMRQGDSSSAEKIFDFFSRPIFGFFAKRTLSREVSEDLVQEVFFKVVKKIETYKKDEGDFHSWIWKIARNTLIDYWRKEGKIKTEELTVFIEDSHQRNWFSRLELIDVFRQIDTLKKEEKEVFCWFFVSGLDYSEISKITGKSEGSLRVAVCRMVKKIRKKIND